MEGGGLMTQLTFVWWRADIWWTGPCACKHNLYWRLV